MSDEADKPDDFDVPPVEAFMGMGRAQAVALRHMLISMTTSSRAQNSVIAMLDAELARLRAEVSTYRLSSVDRIRGKVQKLEAPFAKPKKPEESN